MRTPQLRHGRGLGANMTPMIDVVFLLIIFFLVSSHLARQENRLPLDLPVASTFDPFDPSSAPLTISVDAGANWFVSGKPLDLDGLRLVLRDLAMEAGRDAAIRVRTDGSVPYQHVEPILREAALAGVTDAAIAVREASGP